MTTRIPDESTICFTSGHWVMLRNMFMSMSKLRSSVKISITDCSLETVKSKREVDWPLTQ